jgi:hypothetical protein
MDMLLEVAGCFGTELIKTCLAGSWCCTRTYVVAAAPDVLWTSEPLILSVPDGRFVIGILGLSFDRAWYDYALFTRERKALLHEIPRWVNEVPGVEIEVFSVRDAVPATIEAFYGAEESKPNLIIQANARFQADTRQATNLQQDSYMDIERIGDTYVCDGPALRMCALPPGPKLTAGTEFQKLWGKSGCGEGEQRIAEASARKCNFTSVWITLLRTVPSVRRSWSDAEDPKDWRDFSAWLESNTTMDWRSCVWHIAPFKVLLQEVGFEEAKATVSEVCQTLR